jgi:hypothetical protein
MAQPKGCRIFWDAPSCQYFGTQQSDEQPQAGETLAARPVRTTCGSGWLKSRMNQLLGRNFFGSADLAERRICGSPRSSPNNSCGYATRTRGIASRNLKGQLTAKHSFAARRDGVAKSTVNFGTHREARILGRNNEMHSLGAGETPAVRPKEMLGRSLIR